MTAPERVRGPPARLPVQNVAESHRLAQDTAERKLSFGSAGVGASLGHLVGRDHEADGLGINMEPCAATSGIGLADPHGIAGRTAFHGRYRHAAAEHSVASGDRRAARSSPVEHAHAKSALAPDLPTIAETLPGFDAAAFNYLAAPAGTPAPVIARLNHEVNAILADAAFRRRLGELGLEPIGGTPEQTAATIRAEAARWRAVIVAGKIKVE